MTSSGERIQAIVKKQTTIWVVAIFFASAYALFAKLIWTANFPILIFLPLFMTGFALSSINHVKSALIEFSDADT